MGAAQGDQFGREENAVVSSVSNKKIVFYGMNYAPELIGIGRYSGEIGTYLAEQRARVEVVTTPPHYPGWSLKAPFRNGYSVEQKENLRITRCPLLLRSDMRGIWRLLAPLTFAMSSAPIVMWRILKMRPNVVVCVEPSLRWFSWWLTHRGTCWFVWWLCCC